MLISKLHTFTRESSQTPIEMVHQYNLTTFDIMGDLTFGASLGLLAGTGDDNWVTAIFFSIKANALRRIGRYYPWAARIIQMLVPQALKAKAAAHFKACMQRVDTRIDPARNVHKPDIWGIVMDQKETLRLSRPEMYANSQIFMVAGTETTATALSGLTYHLLRNPEKMDKIVGEIRGAFQSDSDIELGKLARLEYLNACIEEGLRMYPPVPTGLPRVAPGGGLLVCGEHVPAGVRLLAFGYACFALIFILCLVLTSNVQTVLSVNHWATYHDPHNFKQPNEFIPERWISDEYASDNKTALQPFSFGPRNCLGKK